MQPAQKSRAKNALCAQPERDWLGSGMAGASLCRPTFQYGSGADAILGFGITGSPGLHSHPEVIWSRLFFAFARAGITTPSITGHLEISHPAVAALKTDRPFPIGKARSHPAPCIERDTFERQRQRGN